MKRVLVALMSLAICLSAVAVQCEGKTKAGARCKREAAEGGRFCIGHAEQAKPAVQAMEDDGTCWAATEAGTRCKHKKDGESDYCKQHGVDVKAKEAGQDCRAFKWDGMRCTRKAEDGFLYCKQHRKFGPAAEKESVGTENPKPPAKSETPAKKSGSGKTSDTGK